MKIEEALQHFHEKPTPELLQFTNEVALAGSRYLFTEKIKAKQYSAYCTHCNTESTLAGPLKHNEKTTCPACASEVIVKQAGRGRSKMIDTAYVEFPSKSLMDPQKLTIAGYYVVRDYRKDYHDVQTSFQSLALYIFTPGESIMFSRSWWNDTFTKATKTFPLYPGTPMNDLPSYFCYDELQAAIQGTPFAYCQAGDYSRLLVISYLALYCKYPYVEALHKIGLGDIIIDRLRNTATKTINWRGKTLDRIIGLPKRDWKHFRHVKDTITQRHLDNFKHLRTYDAISPTLELMDYAQSPYSYRLIGILSATKTNPQKAFRYIKAQLQKDTEHFQTEMDVVNTWTDFITYASDLGADIQKSANIYISNLYEAHQRQIEQKKAIADERNNRQMAERYEELKHMYFEQGDFLIRPVETPKELANEGNTLNHCVNGYLNRHLQGQCSVFVLRKVGEPDTPYYTVEISNNIVHQVRGNCNAMATPEIEAFINEFKLTMVAPIQMEHRQVS